MLHRSGSHLKTNSVFALAGICAFASGAQAHHPMGGATPSTFMEGLLSGLGHPVIAPDHLAFIVAIGIAAALLPAGLSVIAAFIAGSTLGVLAHTATLGIPFVEQMVALSVVVAGGLIAFGRGTPMPVWQLLAAGAGLFHGYAFGEAVVGADRAVIGAYLIGIAIVASLIAFAISIFTTRVLAVRDYGTQHLRVAGLMLACIGVVMLAGSVVPA